MRMSTYKRMQQSAADHNRNRQSVIKAKFMTAGLSWGHGGYPVNPDAETAYNAGFQRGCHWAFVVACSGKPVEIRWDFADSTYAGNGEHDGWNAAAKALK